MPDPGVVSGNSYIFLPTTGLVTPQGAIDAFMQLPKPVACVALAHATSLAIACWTTFLKSEEARAQRDRKTNDEIQWVRERFANGTAPPRILLKGREEELLLSLDDLATWWRQCELLLPRMHFRDQPSPELRERGVDAMVIYQLRGDD